MKPDKPGFYWFRGEPVKVWVSYQVGLCFYMFETSSLFTVYNTEDSDWGPEIKGDWDE